MLVLGIGIGLIMGFIILLGSAKRANEKQGKGTANYNDQLLAIHRSQAKSLDLRNRKLDDILKELQNIHGRMGM